MQDIKCKGCDKKLLVAVIFVGAIKCNRCKMIFEYKIFNNMFVTTDYDPTQKVLQKDKQSVTIPAES